MRWGTDGAILALGAMLEPALRAAERLAKDGIEVAVINPRFVKPLDETLLFKVFHECRFVLTLEEAQLMGGFGSAVLELANDRQWETRHVKRLGLPDLFVGHGERDDLLDDHQLSEDGIVRTCVTLAGALGNAAAV